ncbi:hypothetical protein K8T06_15800 [bacterium]|nr:hypothetical protein [bacterium]
MKLNEIINLNDLVGTAITSVDKTNVDINTGCGSHGRGIYKIYVNHSGRLK